MSFKDSLHAVTQATGYEAFHDVFNITHTPEGAGRMTELIAKYPVLTGMLAAFEEQCQLDESGGASPTDIEAIGIGFGLAIGALALIAESELGDQPIA